MHKQLFNEAIIKLIISPVGPILIKAGEGEADPTSPDMSFVRTVYGGREMVYLPGSSLKGVLRAHSERLARTVQGKRGLACDPLDDRHACAQRLEKEWSGAQKYKESCFLCQLFGNTSLSSHFRIADAHPISEYRTEERNGVAIDRVFGSVAVGPFNYETVTAGAFETTLYVKNFTLAQLGLLALALRDLSAGRVRLGFAKSRGLGVVTSQVEALTLRYPFCELKEGRLRLLGGRDLGVTNQLIGVGKFAGDESYGYPLNDTVAMPDGYKYETNDWEEVEVRAPKEDDKIKWKPLGQHCVKKWKEVVERGN